MPDYTKLLGSAGLAVRRVNPGRAWWGNIRLDQRSGVRVADTPLANTPAYKGGLDLDDELRLLDGIRVTSPETAQTIIGRRRPGDRISVEFVDRGGAARTGTIVLTEDPSFEVVPVESSGVPLTAAQRAFRQSWLGR